VRVSMTLPRPCHLAGDVRKGKRKRDASPSAGIDAQRPSRKPGTDEKALSRVERCVLYFNVARRTSHVARRTTSRKVMTSTHGPTPRDRVPS
jgi:hypothetical protein